VPARFEPPAPDVPSVLDVPAAVPAVEVPLPWLRPEPFEDAESDADALADADAEALPDADDEALVLGLAAVDAADLVDVAVADAHGVPVAVASFLVPVALTLAGAETVVLLGLAEAVPVVLAVPGAVVVAVSVGLALPAGVLLSPLLVLPVGGVVTELAGEAVGVTDLAGLLGVAEADDEFGAHAGAVLLPWPMAVAWLVRPPFVPPCWVADPATLPAPLPGLCEEVIPTAELSW